MRITAKTDIGLVRKQNQDSYAAGEMPDGISWAVVCDGMGGAAGGAVAGTMAVRMISDKLSTACRGQLAPGMVRTILTSAIESANSTVYDVSCANPDLRGMGTTAVAVITIGNTAYIAHVGDSRAYKITKTQITQVTTDHSMVQQLVDRGEITPEQARVHPERNIITRAVGVNEKVNVDFRMVDFADDEMLLICSDGLSGYVEDDEIFRILHGDDSHRFAENLVAEAKSNGGGDNITVVIISH